MLFPWLTIIMLLELYNNDEIKSAHVKSSLNPVYPPEWRIGQKDDGRKATACCKERCRSMKKIV